MPLGSLLKDVSQLAATIEAMELKTPVKQKPSTAAKTVDDPFLIDDKQKSLSPKSLTEEQEPEEDLRNLYVGEVDLPESERNKLES